MSATSEIRSLLEEGGTITPLEALSGFGCYRLSAVIFNLRKAGVPVRTNRRTVTKANGKKAVIAEYYMEQEKKNEH